MPSQGEETSQQERQAEATLSSAAAAATEPLRTRPSARLAMARPCPPRACRTLSEPEQRELVSLEQQQSQQQRRAFEHDQPDGHHHAPGIRRFEILKSTALGLAFPQNLQLSVVDVDPGIVNTGHLHDLSISSPGRPAFVTTEMKWWKEKYMLPPSFQLLPASPSTHRPHVVQQASEITGLAPSPPHESLGLGLGATKPRSKSGSHHTTAPNLQEPYPLAKIKYPGWQGVWTMTVSLTLYNITPDMHYLPTPPRQFPGSSDLDIRSHWTISRLGWKREYVMTSPSSAEGRYRWRSSSKVLSIPAVDDGHPAAHGNLKLEDPDARLVAVYKQRRDWEVLGALTVFMDHVGGEGKVSVEAVVASCLAIVMYERLGWQNLWGD